MHLSLKNSVAVTWWGRNSLNWLGFCNHVYFVILCVLLWFVRPGVRRHTGRHSPDLLKLILCESSVCVYVCVWVCMCVRSCVYVCVCVYPRLRLLITSGVMWRDMNLIRLVKQVLQLLYGNYIPIIVNGHGLGIGTRYGN